MKRWIGSLLLVLLLMALCACGKQGDASSAVTAPVQEVLPAQTFQPAPTPAPAQSQAASADETEASGVDVDLTVLSSTMVYSEVYNIGSEVGDIHSDSSAAACVNSAHFSGLPYYSGVIEHSAYLRNILGRGIVGRGFSAGAGILCQNNAVIKQCGIAAFKRRLEGRVHSGINIRRQTS